MITALKYLSEITDRLFETHMQRAALRIIAGTQLFPR
jgi:hypothetical protein